jgi:two-component system OmpR family response regulator
MPPAINGSLLERGVSLPSRRADTATVTGSIHMRVLLIEDSRLLAEHLLEQISGIRAVEPLGVVETEERAIDTIALQTPDIIVLDLHLKQGTGFGVLAAITQMNKPPLVIVLTNYALPQYRERATALGAKYFLDKSNEFDRLPTIIREIIETQAA